ELYPTEVPLTSDEAFIKKKSLQGLSLGDVALTAWTPKNKAIKTHRWDMIFTHLGISGAAALRLSQYIVKALKKYHAEDIKMTSELFPDDKEQDVMNRVLEISKKKPKKALRNVWKSVVPERYLLFLLDQSDLDEKTTYHQLRKQKLRERTKLLKAFPVKING